MNRYRTKEMIKVLFTGCTFSKNKIEELKSKGFEIISERLDLTEKGLIKALEDCEGYILGGEEIATKKVIESSPDLKIIAFYGAGYEKYIDMKVASDKKIIVTNTPKANSYTTAEHTVALILDAVKQITYLNNLTKKGGWLKRQAWNLRDKNLGILGMGAVGTNVARIMHNGFGMNIFYVSLHKHSDVEKELNAKEISLVDLLKKSDVVSIHAVYNESTRGLVGKKQLELMKSTSILINTARAEIVDAKALYQVLEDQKILSAAFDLYYQEPVPTPSEDIYNLLNLPDNRFILTPHTAYDSKEAVEAMNDMVIESIMAYLKGEEPKYIVNPDSLRK